MWKILRYVLQPFPKWKILDSSILKKFPDDKFKFDENGRKYSKGIGNPVRKGEIAYEQFLLLPQCFQKTCTTGTSKPGFVWERVNPVQNRYVLDINLLKTLWEKEKMLVTSIFSFFHNVFYPFTRQTAII